jgi:hypothetical protein
MAGDTEIQLGKHVETNAHPTIEGCPLLGIRPLNTNHSNKSTTIRHPLLGNTWVNTPDNNTWYLLLSSWCVFRGWSLTSLYRGVKTVWEDLSGRRHSSQFNSWCVNPESVIIVCHRYWNRESVITNCSYDVWNYQTNWAIKFGTRYLLLCCQDTRDNMNNAGCILCTPGLSSWKWHGHH